jgi:hypothetical protein
MLALPTMDYFLIHDGIANNGIGMAKPSAQALMIKVKFMA